MLFMMAEKILSPLIHYMLKNHISINAFHKIVKRVYFKTAQKNFSIPGKKQTVSRISTLTGMTRHEIARFIQDDNIDEVFEGKGKNRAARVLSGWQANSLFLDSDAKPLSLPFDILTEQRKGDLGESATFTDLVHFLFGYKNL